MMIVGKHFDDQTVLRVAHAYERAVGGFPAPPGVGGSTEQRTAGQQAAGRP
jgi:amidase